MKRSIMNLRIDIVLVQIIIKAQAVSHLNDIKVISMIDIGSIERSLDTIYSGKRFIIASYDFMTTFKTCFRTLQLRNTQGSLKISQTVIVALLLHLVIPATMMLVQ